MSKLIDITGQTFYEWTVLKRGESTADGRTRWLCRCSCGKEKLITSYDLRNGKHKSCGHSTSKNKEVIKKEQKPKKDVPTRGNGFIDITGQKFGEWTVLEYVGERKWLCRCSCGKEEVKRSNSIRTGKSKSCGHYFISPKLEDLKGKQFNEWTVLEYNGKYKWLCRCSCGTEKLVAAYDLKNGNSRNCGHNRKKPYNDLTGRRFGSLVVLEYTGSSMYKCKCDCGTVKEVAAGNLLNGGTVGCGCRQIISKYTKEFMENTILEMTNEYGDKPYAKEVAEKLGITYYYVNKLLNEYKLKSMMNDTFRSSYEKELFEIVSSMDETLQVVIGSRSVLGNGKELDIYIPARKLAIEFNGVYYHSDIKKSSGYHQEKTITAAKKGITIIHIFEHEWNDKEKKNKIIKLLESKICSNRKIIGARECVVKKVGLEEERKFLEENHLQGYTNSEEAYGLMYENEIVSILTIGKPRFNNNYEYELIRYCSKDGYGVSGGIEKMFKQFIKEKDPESVVSYTDISKFTGNVYTKLGFKADLSCITKPGYEWVKQIDTYVFKSVSRYKTQKHKLIEQGLDKYGNTEDEIMKSLGFMKLYDCGNLRLSWYKKA